jgi:hypothetical protein
VVDHHLKQLSEEKLTIPSQISLLAFSIISACQTLMWADIFSSMQQHANSEDKK